MKSQSGLTMTVLAGLIAFMVVSAALLSRGQQMDAQSNMPSTIQQDNKPINNQLDNKDVPVANYDEPLSSDPQEKARRQKVNKSQNAKFSDPPPPNAKNFMLTPASESSYGIPPTHVTTEPALPVKQSAAIIIGNVTSAKAYLSEDKINIYSEFEVANPVVLKNTTSETLGNGKSFFINRFGGGLKFPTGKIIYIYSTYRPMPKVGGKFLFFLDYSSEGGFTINTGYELTKTGVIPLDGLLDKVIVRHLAGMQSFRGISEADLLAQVKEAIQTNSDVMTNGATK